MKLPRVPDGRNHIGGSEELEGRKPEVEECGDFVVIDGMKLDVNK